MFYTTEREEVEAHWRAAYPDLWKAGLRPPRWATSVRLWADELALRYKDTPLPTWLAAAVDGRPPGAFRKWEKAPGWVERRPGWAGGHRARL